MSSSKMSKSAYFRRAAITATIDICSSSAEILANMAKMDECAEAICSELDQYVGNDASEKVSAAYATAFEVIKAEVSQLLFDRLLDCKNGTCL